MSERYYIVIGDQTTMQGVVITGNPMIQINGKMVACEGDMVQCPTCLCPGIIKAMGSRADYTIMGAKTVALEDDICICKCVPPPKLKASQTLMKSVVGL